MKSRRRSRTESESTPEFAPANPPPSGSKDVPTSRTGIAPESENSQVPPEVPSETGREGRAFDEVAREALRATGEVVQGEKPSGSPIPSSAMVEYSLASRIFSERSTQIQLLLCEILLRGRLRLLGPRPRLRLGRLTPHLSSSTMLSRCFLQKQKRDVKNKTN